MHGKMPGFSDSNRIMRVHWDTKLILKIIGAMGENGSGKDEILSYLKLSIISFYWKPAILSELSPQKRSVNPQGVSWRISSKFPQFGKGYL